MGKLSEPSADLVSRVLNEVGFEDRLMGYRFRERTGPMSMTLYSFEEIVEFLNDPHPRIDFNRLEEWVREVMKDEELAGEINKIILRDDSDQKKSIQIRDMMGERLLQCIKRSSNPHQ